MTSDRKPNEVGNSSKKKPIRESWVKESINKAIEHCTHGNPS